MWVRRPKYPLLSLLTLSLPRCHLETTHNSKQFETRKPFWHWHVKGSPSKRIALKINVIGLENMLLCITQLGNVTGWDSEGVKWPIHTNLIFSSGKISLQFFDTAPEFLHLCFVLIRSALRVLQLCDPLPQWLAHFVVSVAKLCQFLKMKVIAEL